MIKSGGRGPHEGDPCPLKMLHGALASLGHRRTQEDARSATALILDSRLQTARHQCSLSKPPPGELLLRLGRLRARLLSMRTRVRSLASLRGLRIWRCRELWCRLQTWLGSCIAVAVVWAGCYSSDLTPSLRTSICHRYGPKKPKAKNKQTNKQTKQTKKFQKKKVLENNINHKYICSVIYEGIIPTWRRKQFLK